MTTSNINPVEGSLLLPGDGFSFDLDDGGTTPSSIQVSIEGAGTTVAWTLASGFGSGYSGTSVKVGNVYSITVSREDGWDASPFTVNVDWTISGTPSTSSWSYELANEVAYPDLMQPRNPLAQGTLVITDNDDAVSSICGWLDITGTGYTLTNLGNGKVRLELTDGGISMSEESQLRFAFDDSVSDSDPGSGLIRYNNATFGSVTYLYIDDESAGAIDNSDLLSTLSEGDFILIGNQTDKTAGALFEVGASPTVDGTGYFKVNVAPLSGTLPAVDDELCIDIVRASTSSLNTSGVDTWTLSSISGANASAGEASFNSATAGSVTSIKVAYQSIARSLEPWLQGIAVGDFFLIRETGGAKGLTKRVTAVTDDPGNSQVTYTVSEVTGGSSGSFAGTETLDVDLLPGPGKLSGAGAPGVSTGDGYPLGTTYADTTADEGYVLTDNTPGANVWSTATGAGGGSGNLAAIEWTWLTGGGAPGSGQWTSSSTNKNTVSSLKFHETSNIPSSVLYATDYVSQLSVGDLIIVQLVSSPGTGTAIYRVNAAPTLALNVWTVPVTYLKQSGATAFSNGVNYSVSREAAPALSTEVSSASGTITSATYGLWASGTSAITTLTPGKYLVSMNTDMIHSSAGATTDFRFGTYNAIFSVFTPSTNSVRTIINDTTTERQSVHISGIVNVTAVSPNLACQGRTTSATATLGNSSFIALAVG